MVCILSCRTVRVNLQHTFPIDQLTPSFERWCGPGAIPSTNIQSYRLPPVDVVMVWHAYLLNPGYAVLVNAMFHETYSF